MDTKYPGIKVRLSGEDGNAFAILGRVERALKNNGVSKSERKEFRQEATSGDYNKLIQTCMKWVSLL